MSRVFADRRKISNSELKQRVISHLVADHNFGLKELLALDKKAKVKYAKMVDDRGYLIEYLTALGTAIGVSPTKRRSIRQLQRQVEGGDLLEGDTKAEVRKALEEEKAKKLATERAMKAEKQKERGQADFIDKMSKTLPKTMVEAACAAASFGIVDDKILLLNIWKNWGKPDSSIKLSMREQNLITKCLDDLSNEEKILAAIQRCKEFYDLAPGLERFAYNQKEYKRTKPLWEKIHNVLPRLLELLAKEEISLEDTERWIEVFGDIPQAIMEILDGADEDAVAMKYDRLQL